jgi:hypothetical protein
MASQLARCRWLVRCALLVLLVAVALCLVGGLRAAGAQMDKLVEAPLSREVTTDAEALGGEILRSYESIPSRDRERRTVGSFGDSFYGTPLATELTVVYYSGKHSGYILQADYAKNAQHTISPARVTKVRISEFRHIPAGPLWHDGLSVESYSVLLEAAHHEPLETRQWPLYWNVTVEYQEGQDVGFGTTNYGIDPAKCDNSLSASALAPVNAQAKEVIKLATAHAPIRMPQNLVSFFAPCYLR